MTQNDMATQIVVRSLKAISEDAYEVFWEEKQEHGSYEDAAAMAIDYAIGKVIKLMEPEPEIDEKSISELYWETVSN